MTGLDCNILVQLALADHPANTRTRSAVDVEFKKNENLVFPPLVATEFLHVVTDARRFSPPLEIKEAIEWLEDFLAHPLVNLIQPNEDSLRQTMEWMKQQSRTQTHSGYSSGRCASLQWGTAFDDLESGGLLTLPRFAGFHAVMIHPHKRKPIVIKHETDADGKTLSVQKV